MKRKSMVAILMAMVTMALSLTGCGERTDIVEEPLIVRNDEQSRTGCLDGCTCTGCKCCGTDLSGSESSTTLGTTDVELEQTESVEDTQTVYSEIPETQSATENVEENQTQEQQSETEKAVEIAQLTEGELRARRDSRKILMRQDSFCMI